MFTSYLDRTERVRLPESGWSSREIRGHTAQEVCPWNAKFAQPVSDRRFQAREAIAGKDASLLAADILAMIEDEFRTLFKGSAMKRAKARGLRRNAQIQGERIGKAQ
ncbi:MAG: hypothetical protein KGO03_10905 [Gemmatimonadota bacterium]|nr:hypothetical protein [Gemmatimonadota bacterium]MDE3216902.1 hypothetical protein [Gemmatimonadota bacterium]